MGARQSKPFTDIAPVREENLSPLPRRRRLRKLHRVLFGRRKQTWAEPTRIGREMRGNSSAIAQTEATGAAPAPTPAPAVLAPDLLQLLPPRATRRPEILIDRLPTPPAVRLLPVPTTTGPLITGPIVQPRLLTKRTNEDEEDWDVGGPFAIPYPDPETPQWSTPVPTQAHLSHSPYEPSTTEQPRSPLCAGEAQLTRIQASDSDALSTYGPNDTSLDPWASEDDESLDCEIALICQDLGANVDILKVYHEDFEAANYLECQSPSSPLHSLTAAEEQQVKLNRPEKPSRKAKRPKKSKVKAFKKKRKGPTAHAGERLSRKIHPVRSDEDVFSGGATIVNAPVTVGQDLLNCLPGMVP